MTEVDQLDTFLDDEIDSESFNSYANVQSHMRRQGGFSQNEGSVNSSSQAASSRLNLPSNKRR